MLMYYWVLLDIASPFENSIWLNCSPFFLCFYLEKEKKVWDSIRRVGLHLFIDADVLCFQLVCKVTDDHLLFFLGCGAVKIHQKHIEMPHPIFRALTHIISVLSSFQGDKKPGLQLCRESRRDGGEMGWSGFFRRVSVLFNRFWLLCQDCFCFLKHLGRTKRRTVIKHVSTRTQSILKNFKSSFNWSYWHKLHILEKFLYETSWGQAKCTVG